MANGRCCRRNDGRRPALVTGSRFAGLLILIGLVAAAPRSARASVGLDPFRRVGAPAAGVTLDPVRVADASPAPSSSPASPAPVRTTAKVAKVCETDSDCPDESICEQQVCQVVQSSTNILYLYYREGTFREIAGLYWSKRGASGFTFLAPIYWHTWTPKSRSHVFAPLFWRFENYVSRNVVTVVVPLVIRSSSPDSSFTWVFPLNFGWRDKDEEHTLVI